MYVCSMKVPNDWALLQKGHADDEHNSEPKRREAVKNIERFIACGRRMWIKCNPIWISFEIRINRMIA